MSLAEKWEKEEKPLQPLKNSDLICSSCRRCTTSVTSCGMYAVKPLSVLKGGVCHGYKK